MTVAAGRELRAALPWLVMAAAAAVGLGLLAGADSRIPLDIAVAGIAIGLVAWWPLGALVFFLVVLMRYPNAPENFFPAYVAAAGGLVGVFVLGRGGPGRRLALPLILFILVAAPSLALLPAANEPNGAEFVVPVVRSVGSATLSPELIEWLALAALAGIFCLAAWAIRTRAALRTLQIAVVVMSVYPVEVALRQYARGELQVRPGQDSAFAAVRGPFDHPNYLAFYLVVVLTLTIVMLIEERRMLPRIALGALVAADATCLLFTYTRSAWVGFAVAIAVLGVVRYRWLLVTGVVMLAVAAFAFPASSRKVAERFGDRSSQSAAHSSSSWDWRYKLWKRIVPYGWRKPATGQGFGRFERVTIREMGLQDRDYPIGYDAEGRIEGFSAHNDYVKTFVEAGLVGLALWVLWLLALLVGAARATRAPPARDAATAMVAATVAVLVMSGSDNLEGYPLVLATAAALTGAAVGVARSSERSREGSRAPSVPLPPASAPGPASAPAS
jgi:putative inorganic carbon (hco3(-)) transporter